MDAAILPACQAEFPVATCFLPRLKHLERGEEANQVKVGGAQESTVFLHNPGLDHHFINNKVVSLCGHRGDGVSHAAHGTFEDRAGPYGNDRLAAVLRRLEHEAIWMGKHLLRQHVYEGVHGDVQERLGGDRLKRLCRGAFPDAADAVQYDDLRLRFQVVLRRNLFDLVFIVGDGFSRKGCVLAKSRRIQASSASLDWCSRLWNVFA